MTLKRIGTTVVNADQSFVLGNATPATPVVGMIRWNSATSVFQIYDGTSWTFIQDTGGSAGASPTRIGIGLNNVGQLGDGTTTNKSTAIAIVEEFTDWIQIDTNLRYNTHHTTAIRANGTAWAWGQNNFGQLGDNSTTNRSSPVSVVGGFTDWVQISAGGTHTTAIRANGTAWAWGQNNYGQLGDNSTTNRSSPVSVVGGFTDWIQISAGDNHSLAIRANGTAWGWGENNVGQLGDNSTTYRSSPVSVVGGFTDWIQISAGQEHSLAIRANGTAWGWGSSRFGRLGDNTTVSKRSPVAVVGGFTDWVQISAGTYHSLAIRANGTAWAWGRNGSGQLGDDSTADRTSPVSVVGGFTDWIQISAGDNHSVAIRANGSAWGWGENTVGQLGDGVAINDVFKSPVNIALSSNWVHISAGCQNTMAIRAVQ